MNLKKCLKGIVASACVMLSGALILTGCGTEDPEKPEIVINNPTGYTYYWDGQHAYKNQDKMVEGSYVIVNPTNAQEVLDHESLSNKVVIFTEGVYEDLHIRPGYNTETTAYAYNAEHEVKGDEISLETVRLPENINTAYTYYRQIDNVVFAGTKNSVFTGDISCRSGMVEWDEVQTYDAVKGKHYIEDDDGVQINHISVEDVEFTEMNFTNKDLNDKKPGSIRVLFTQDAQKDIDSFSNVSVNKCSFVALHDGENYVITKDGGDWIESSAVAIWYTGEESGQYLLNNISYVNNYIEGYHLGLKASSFNGYEVVGNTIKNTEHNAIAIQSSAVPFTGEVIVKNNNIDGALATLKDPTKEIGERAIRIGKGVDTQIIIENNSFANCGQYGPTDRKAELLKIVSLTETEEGETSFSFVNNTYNGKAIITDKAGENHANYVVYIDIDYSYSLEGTKAYRTRIGSNTKEELAEGTFVLVDPTNAQSTLDNTEISNKVVIFTEGVYENLNLRPGNNDETTEYKENHKKRTITNVIFAGTEGAKFTGDFACQVTGTNHMNIDGIEFTGMNFTNKDADDITPGCLKFSYNTSAEVDVDICRNVSVNNCSFIALFNDENNNGKFDADSEEYIMTKQYEDNWQNSIAVTFHTSTQAMAGIFYENISYRNNYIEGYHLGLKASVFNNYEVINNITKNTEHNGIAIQSEGVNTFTGTVRILNNIIDGTLATKKTQENPVTEIGERAIRIGKGNNTIILIADNTIKNCGQYKPGDEQKELLKMTSLTGESVFTFFNNTYEGELITQLGVPEENYAGYTIYVDIE